MYILSYLNLKDLLILARVSNDFARLTEDNTLWRPIALKLIAADIYPSLEINENDSTLSIKEQILQAKREKIKTQMRSFLSGQVKTSRTSFKPIKNPSSADAAQAWENTINGALAILPIFTWGAGQMALAKGDDFITGLINFAGVALLPGAMIGDALKAFPATCFTLFQLTRLALHTPQMLFGSKRDITQEEEKIYVSMRFALFIAIHGLKELELVTNDSLKAMSDENRMEPLMAMTCFLVAFNSLGMGRDTLLLDEMSLTKAACPSKFLSTFERIVDLRDTLKSNFQDASSDELTIHLVEWVSIIWDTLKSDKNDTNENQFVSNDIAKDIIQQLKDLLAVLEESGLSETASKRMTKHFN